MDNYYVVVIDTNATWVGTTGPKICGNHNENVKDVQDRLAEYAGENLDRLIYTVVPKDDFHEFYRSQFVGMFGSK